MKNRNEKINDLMRVIGERKIMGVVALKNVFVVDKPFAESNNSISDILRSIDVLSWQQPIVCDPVRAQTSTAGDVTAFGSVVTLATDLVVPIRFYTAAFNLLATKDLWVLGYIVTQRFTQNAVAAQYTLSIRNYYTEGPGEVIYTPANRDAVVMPEGGANSVSEFIVFNMLPSGQFPFDATNKQFNDPIQQNQGFIVPFNFAQQNGATNQNLGIVSSAVLVFKDQVAVSQNISVTPILCHQQTAELVADLLLNRYKN